MTPYDYLSNRRSDMILTVSQFSKDEIGKFFGMYMYKQIRKSNNIYNIFVFCYCYSECSIPLCTHGLCWHYIVIQ